MKTTIIVLAALAAAVLAEDRNASGKKNETAVEGRSLLLGSPSLLGACPPCPCGYGASAAGMAGGLGHGVGSLGLGSGAGLPNGVTTGVHGTDINTAVGAPSSGEGLSGAGLTHGSGGIVTPGAGIASGVVGPVAGAGPVIAPTGGVGVVATPVVAGPGIVGGLDAGHGSVASGHSGFQTGSGFANQAGGHKAGQGSFAYNVGGSDSSSYGHSSSYGDSKSFGVTASEGFNRAQGQGNHGSEFNKQAAGSAASSHSSGTKTKVVV